MIEIIINILGFAALAHLVVDMIMYLDIEDAKRKPFNCNMCMAFWISIIPFFVHYGAKGILLASLSAIVSEIIYKKLQ